MAGIVIGGLVPALVFGAFGLMQKQCMRAGLGVGPFFVVVGATVTAVGLASARWAPYGALTPAAALWGLGYGLLWSLGISLILLAVDRLQGSISQLAPLYNANTLVTVLLGGTAAWEWQAGAARADATGRSLYTVVLVTYLASLGLALATDVFPRGQTMR